MVGVRSTAAKLFLGYKFAEKYIHLLYSWEKQRATKSRKKLNHWSWSYEGLIHHFYCSTSKMKSARYKLVYFNFYCRAEIIRMMFAEADVAFEDIRVEMKEWPNIKPRELSYYFFIIYPNYY